MIGWSRDVPVSSADSSGERVVPAPPDHSRGGWALAGLAAGAAGTGVAELTAAVTGPSSAPLVAVSQTFIDLTPPWLKDVAIATFGTHDKLALLVGAVAVLAALSVVTGSLMRRAPGPARSLVLGVGAVASLAAATRPDATPLSVVPSVAGVMAGAATLTVLRHRSLAAGPGRADARRALLTGSAVALAGGAAGVAAGRWLGRAAGGAEPSRAAVRLPAPSSRAPALPGDVEVGVEGVVPFRVPTPDFFRIDTATVIPRGRAEDWTLRLHGMVDREVTLDFARLLAGPLVERDLTLICVSNEVGGDLTGNARWLGLPIAALLRQAGPHPEADMVLSTSADGWTCSTPLDALTDGRDALLAVGMNGEPLPIEHGFPVRLVVPGLYGYVSATKWVTDLEVTRFDRAQGYWTARGWSARAPVKTQARIDVPREGDRVRAGQVAVAGIAWAQHRGIRGVEVRVDDGPWQPARLGAEVSVDTWRQWVFAWQATSGRHRLAVRATDATGAVQTGDQSPPVPDGATGWHTIDVAVI